MDSIRLWENKNERIYIPQVAYEKKPKEGQEFKSLDEIYDFYNKYAREAGFSVRIDKNKNNKDSGEIYWRQYVCYKEGETDETTYKRKKEKEKEINDNVEIGSKKLERRRGKVREGCKARLIVVQRGENYIVSQFNEGHSHSLATPSKVHLLRSHRKVSNAKKALAQQFGNINIPTYQQFDILETQAGGIQNVGCTERDLRNYKRDMREKFKGHDADMLYEYFQTEKEKNPAFFFEFDSDENGRMTRCFWVDAIARKAYNCFGDVVVFDTTYNTNRYSMVFAPLLGVNHHGKTTIFGCGFLSGETVDSFIWLFETWLKAMPKCAPNVIITDQDPAMEKAIAQALPHTFHRYCIWHIMKKFPEKLDSIIFRDHYDLFKSSIWNSETVEEFERTWNDALEASKQVDNHWLKKMFALRDRWVPVFVNKYFSAGMSSSQRAESSHAFFKKYCDKNNSLMDCIIRFNRAISHLRHEEVTDNHVDVNEQPKLRSAMPMEMQIMDLYTKQYFHKFQVELYESSAYVINFISEDENQSFYEVTKVCKGKFKVRRLLHDKGTDVVNCSCRKFEFEGIPCRHILAFLKMKQIMFLPEYYIMKRWMKFARVESVVGQDGVEIEDAPDKSILIRHTKLSQLAATVIDEVAVLEEGSEILTRALETVLEQVKGIKAIKFEEKNSHVQEKQFDIPQQRNFNDPLQVRAKGCGKRLKSWQEKGKTKARRCNGCGKLGQTHDKRNCPILNNRSTANTDDDISNELEYVDSGCE